MLSYFVLLEVDLCLKVPLLKRQVHHKAHHHRRRHCPSKTLLHSIFPPTVTLALTRTRTTPPLPAKYPLPPAKPLPSPTGGVAAALGAGVRDGARGDVHGPPAQRPRHRGGGPRAVQPTTGLEPPPKVGGGVGVRGEWRRDRTHGEVKTTTEQ